MLLKTTRHLLTVALVSLPVAACASSAPAAAATFPGCSAFSSQPAAQRAWEQAGRPGRYDGDKDGQVCESLKHSTSTTNPKNCRRSRFPIAVLVSRAKYPETSLHIETAWKMGVPRIWSLDRAHADARRAAWHAVINKGWDSDGDGTTDDMDEAPMAFTAQGGRTANIALVDPKDNRGAGSTIASRLRRYCDKQKFVIRFYSHRLHPTRILIVAANGRRIKRWVSAAR